MKSSTLVMGRRLTPAGWGRRWWGQGSAASVTLSPVHLGSPRPSPPSLDGDGPSLSQVTLQTPTTRLWDVPSPPFLPT